MKAASVAWRPLTHDAERWFVSLMETLTAFVSYTTMALVEEGRLLGTRQLDMGNSGLHRASLGVRVVPHRFGAASGRQAPSNGLMRSYLDAALGRMRGFSVDTRLTSEPQMAIQALWRTPSMSAYPPPNRHRTYHFTNRTEAENLCRLVAVDPVFISPNPPKDTDGRREDSGRGVRELQGR